MRAPMALGVVPTTHILGHDHISVGHEDGCEFGGVLFVVWGAQENHGELAIGRLPVARGAIDVGREFDSVAHGDHNVLCLADPISAIALSIERNAGTEREQQDNKGNKTEHKSLVEIPHRYSPNTDRSSRLSRSEFRETPH